MKDDIVFRKYGELVKKLILETIPSEMAFPDTLKLDNYENAEGCGEIDLTYINKETIEALREEVGMMDYAVSAVDNCRIKLEFRIGKTFDE